MKKVLLINRGSDTDNIGDEAINYTLSELLKKIKCEVRTANYTLLFANPRSGIDLKSLVKNVWNIFKISKKKYDCVLIGGGQLIQSNSKFPISLLIWILFLKMFKQRVILYGVGVDEYFSKQKKRVFKIAFNFISDFYVRDEESQQNLKKNFNKNSLVVVDSVFCISKLYRSTTLKESAKIKLFGITHYSSIKRYGYMKVEEEEYLKEQTEILINLDTLNDFRIICNTISDFQYAKIFQEYIYANYKKEYQIITPKDLFDYINIVESSQLMVSSRMHALIIAYSYGVKIIPIERNDKLKAFSRYYCLQKPKEILEQNLIALKNIVFR